MTAAQAAAVSGAGLRFNHATGTVQDATGPVAASNTTTFSEALNGSAITGTLSNHGLSSTRTTADGVVTVSITLQ